MRKVILGFVMLACVAAYGQEGIARINFVGDDTGYCWVNGTQVSVDSNWVGYAPIHVGKNVMAFWVWDHCWTGGFCASIDAENGVDTPHTDASTKCIDYPVQGGNAWMTDTNYDDSHWQTAGDYGALADDTGGNPKRVFENNGMKVAQLFYDRAHWIWTPKRILMRKQFTSNQTSGTVYLRGNGCIYTLYVNGQQRLQSTSVIRWGSTGTPLAQASTTLNNGTNVVAIDATCLDSIDFAWVKIAV